MSKICELDEKLEKMKSEESISLQIGYSSELPSSMVVCMKKKYVGDRC